MASNPDQTMEQSFADGRYLKLYFVLEDEQESENATEMCRRVFEISEEKGILPEWIKESELHKQTLTKRMLCVVQKFEGHLFDALRRTDCLILGPLCLLRCLMKGEPCPDGPAPIFSLAMRGIKVTVSGIGYTQKRALQEKIEFMGGRYDKCFGPETTHLVSNQVTSQKYNMAFQKKLPVMQEEWIHEAWLQCQTKNVHATDPPLISMRLPTFSCLRVCASQVNRAKKENIKNMIETQGGTYCTNLSEKDTTVLVAGKGHSDKVKAAQRWKIPCVREQWVEESFNAGYALSYTDYELPENQRCSTPDQDKTFLDPNFSMMSAISSASSTAHVINETIMNDTTMTFIEPEPKKPRVLSLATAANKKTEPHLRTPEKSSKKSSTEAVLREIEALEARDIKKAGSFLDGCKMYLSGFTSSVLDKVRKILNCGGATRFDQITDEVSHVLVAGDGLSTEEQRTAMQFQPHVVSAAWLLASLKQGHQVNIDPYLCYESQQNTEPSPLSKKGLAMWKKSPVGVAKNLNAESDLHLVKQYIQFDTTSPDKSEHTQLENTDNPARVEEEDELAQPLNDEETDDTSPGMFSGLKFWCVGFDDEVTERILLYVKSCGAKLSQQNADYTLVPVEGTDEETSGVLVNQSWLEECAEKEELIPIKYYHKPIQLAEDVKPLTNVVLAISSYTGTERNFLTALSTALGALFQEVFAKKRNPERNAEASTHLLCPTPTGSKYDAAIKWKLPVVKAEWLLACAEQGVRVPEEPYLLAGSTIIRDATDTPNRSDATIISNATLCNIQPSNQSDNIATPDRIVKPLSAIPSRLRTPASGSKPPEPPLQETIVTPVNDKTLPHQFVTPASVKKTPTTDPYTPLANRTPSQQYTPYTPAPLCKEDQGRKETPGVTATPGVDVTTVTPKSYNNYWSKKVPDNQPTPETPYGDALIEDPTPGTRKEWKEFMHTVSTEDTTPVGRKRARGLSNTPSTNTEAKKYKQSEEQEVTKTPSKNIEENDQAFQTPGPSSSPSAQSPSFVQNSVNKTVLSNTKLVEEDTVEESVCEKENEVKYKFMFTGFEESDRETIEHAVLELGGEMSELTCFDPSATHLVMNRPMRSEKLLASIAAGKWIVHHSFVINSRKTGRFLPEEQFEWGNPNAEGLPTLIPNMLEESLASACYRWRSRLQCSDLKGAFADYKAILLTQPNKAQAFGRLIKAGGGDTLDLEPPFSDPKDATHCFVEQNKMALIDKAALESKNVVIVPPIYLNDFLLKEISPQQWLEDNKASTRTPRR